MPGEEPAAESKTPDDEAVAAEGKAPDEEEEAAAEADGDYAAADHAAVHNSRRHVSNACCFF